MSVEGDLAVQVRVSGGPSKYARLDQSSALGRIFGGEESGRTGHVRSGHGCAAAGCGPSAQLRAQDIRAGRAEVHVDGAVVREVRALFVLFDRCNCDRVCEPEACGVA